MKNKILFMVNCTENKPNADYAKQMAENKHCTEKLSELYLPVSLQTKYEYVGESNENLKFVIKNPKFRATIL